MIAMSAKNDLELWSSYWELVHSQFSNVSVVMEIFVVSAFNYGFKCASILLIIFSYLFG